MREIKFRGWDIKNKIMFDVNHIDFIDGITNQSAFKSKQCIFKGPYKEIVLMQYTGLKDKNGKEIYEGDIVQGYFNHGMQFREGVVKFSIGRFIVDGFTYVPLHEFLEGNNTNLEIIGNIYENPYLLNN